MERVRAAVFGCLLAFGLLFCPTAAYASDGFLGGLEDLAGIREVETQQEDQREPVAEPVDELPENGLRTGETENGKGDILPMVGVRQFLAGFRFSFNGTSLNLWSHMAPTRTVLVLAVTAGVLFVFLWWGVRKSIRMIFGAFRKGRASL